MASLAASTAATCLGKSELLGNQLKNATTNTSSVVVASPSARSTKIVSLFNFGKKADAPAPKKSAKAKAVAVAPADDELAKWYGPDRRIFLPDGLLDRSEIPEYLDGEIPGDYGYDPFGLGKKPEDLAKYRAFELIHARWAMLGAAGCIIPEAFNKYGANCGPEAVWFKTGALLLDGNTLNYFGKNIPINLVLAVVAEVVLVGGAEYYRITNGLGQMSRSPPTFPPAARRMETLNDLMAASDVISLHCALTDETVQIINAECLKHIKPGAYLVNTGSSQLLDDCAVKQLLIDGILSGCALDGAEGPQWMEAWVREMPNVLVLPRSADYSEEVWMEIREKAISILQSYFLDGIVPVDAVSDEEDEESSITNENEQSDRQRATQNSAVEQLTVDNSPPESSQRKGPGPLGSPSQHQDNSSRSEGKRSRSSKKAKKRHARQKSQQKLEDALEKESTSQREDDTAMSGTEQNESPGSRGASPDGSRSRKIPMELVQESQRSGKSVITKSMELVKDGCIVALHAREHCSLHVSRQRVKGGGWFLDTISDVTKRDPAAQFLVVFGSKGTIGLRSLASGGKFLQINRRMEFVFASHSLDVWESWTLEGPLEECRLINCRNTQAVLNVRFEVLATVGEEDGILRWLD